jgi:hypothetical protein
MLNKRQRQHVPIRRRPVNRGHSVSHTPSLHEFREPAVRANCIRVFAKIADNLHQALLLRRLLADPTCITKPIVLRVSLVPIMNFKTVPCFALLLAGWFANSPNAFAFGGISPWQPDPALPGVSKGKVETYWLAPYVLISQEYRKTTVTWFTEDGQVRRQTAVSGVEPGFVDVIEEEEPLPPLGVLRQHVGNVVYEGVNEDWKITLPTKFQPGKFWNGIPGYVTSTPDSRVFVHEYHPDPAQITLDIYIHGELSNTAGPFWQYLGRGVELHENGSATLPVWKDEAHSTAQIVTMDTNGVVCSRVDCGKSVDTPNTAPATKPVSQGGSPDLHLPEKAQVLAVGCMPKLTIYAVAELYKPGPWGGAEWTLNNSGKEWIRTFYAVQDGSVIARWQAPTPRRLAGEDHDHFLSLDGKLFYVTASEFVQLDPDEIMSKKNGWH